MQLHREGASAEILQQAVIHCHHILGGEAVAGLPASHHWRGVKLEVVEGISAEGGGLAVTQQLQCGWGEDGAADPELQEVLAALQVVSLIGRLRSLVAVVVCPEDAGFGAIGDFSELTWRRNKRESVDRETGRT